ncbi:MAG: helix-turn-helix domain-containing protein [Alphaproteobacteria bacterium]|nr:helix-turn-helix domain-containing protein [Alphaproteobacteria bacterium]MDD9919749.1 helix-turn-helix domain-containing protein [Alphaproteobacteria bacterium]
MLKRKNIGWHRADIKAAIYKTGHTLESASLMFGYHAEAVSGTLSSPWSQVEAKISELINVPACELWPERYAKNGKPKSQRSAWDTSKRIKNRHSKKQQQEMQS